MFNEMKFTKFTSWDDVANFFDNVLKEFEKEAAKNNSLKKETTKKNAVCENAKSDKNNTVYEKCYCTYSGYMSENIYDKENNYVGVRLFFAVPGLAKEDIKVSLTDNVIRVYSDKTVFSIGKLDTKVMIKFEVLEKNVKSFYNNGLLTVEVYKEKRKIQENLIKID